MNIKSKIKLGGADALETDWREATKEEKIEYEALRKAEMEKEISSTARLRSFNTK